jgi:hypothetical protein
LCAVISLVTHRLAKAKENYAGVKEAVTAIRALDLPISDKDYFAIR